MIVWEGHSLDEWIQNIEEKDRVNKIIYLKILKNMDIFENDVNTKNAQLIFI